MKGGGVDSRTELYGCESGIYGRLGRVFTSYGHGIRLFLWLLQCRSLRIVFWGCFSLLPLILLPSASGAHADLPIAFTTEHCNGTSIQAFNLG
jgi:hypothetical protein